MTTTNDELKSILHANPIDGVDYNDGLNRFNGQVSIYARIIRSFINNTPKTLEILARPEPENNEDYTVTVHGLKGSCYGISATKQGDEARVLEFASKDKDWAMVKQNTPALIEHVKKLIFDLEHLMSKIDTAISSESTDLRPVLNAPDKEVLQSLLLATKSFDIDAIRGAVERLDKARYSFDDNLARGLYQNIMNFRYDLIEDKAIELLERFS